MSFDSSDIIIYDSDSDSNILVCWLCKNPFQCPDLDRCITLHIHPVTGLPANIMSNGQPWDAPPSELARARDNRRPICFTCVDRTAQSDGTARIVLKPLITQAEFEERYM